MSNTSHTPGPWKFGYTDNLEYPLIIGADDEVVCVMRGWVSIKDGNLLAMAPELLEDLKRFVKVMDESYDYPDTSGEVQRLREAANEARAAIAKATGGDAA